MKVLVTGSGGFIFSNFIRKAFYLKKDYEITSIDRIKHGEVIKNIYANKSHKFYIGDACDTHLLNILMEIERPDIVVHGAALSGVDESINSPAKVIKNNIDCTQAIIDASIQWKVKQLIYISCYDEDTKAVTSEGLKHYSEIKPGDTVLSLNTETGLPEEKRVEKVIIQDYEGEMYNFNSGRVNLKVTPNHRFLYENLKGEKEWGSAEEIASSKEKKYLPQAKWNPTRREEIDIPNIGTVNAEALFYVAGFFIGDGFTGYQEREVDNKSGFSKKDRMAFRNDKGHFVKKTGGPQETSLCKSYRIYFDVPEKDKGRKSLEEALKKLGISFTSPKNKSGEHIYFSSKKWMDFFEDFGKYAFNKQIPQWMFSFESHLLEALWKGIHDADGHGLGKADKNGINLIPSITTVSPILKAQLLYIGAVLGKYPWFGVKTSSSEIEGRSVKGVSFYIQFPEARKPLLPAPTKTFYKGKVWCLKVQDNKNFLVERGGKTAFCGNTDEVYGALDSENDAPWTEESPLCPKNPYSASKAAGELLVRAAGNTYGLPFKITRSANNYGPRQTTDKLIPRVIERVLKNEPIPVYGEGKQVRDWIHVFDNCEAIMTVIEKGKEGETYNIGAGQEFSNIEVVNMICDSLGKGHELITFVKDRPGHDFRYSLDSTKTKELGWDKTFKFRDGIQHCVQWFVNNQWWFGERGNNGS